jgi:phage-related protein
MADTPTMEVRARLTADSAQFVQGMNNATAAANELTKTASRVNTAMTGISIAAAAGMGGLVALGVQSFMAAARVQELDIAINAVGKSTGLGYDAINQAALGIKEMGIEMAVAQRSALMFAQNNLKLADASKLARTAQDLAVLSGKNSTEEFQLLTYAVMTQRSELFKSAGVNGSVQGAYEKMAQSLGKSTKQLTAAEKVQAAMNMALEEGAKVAGTYEAAMTSPGKVLRSFARLNDDLMVAVGGALLKGIGPMIVSLYQLEKTIVHAVEGTGAFHDIITALTAVMVHIFKPITAFIDGLKGSIEKMDKAKINVEKLAEKLNNILPILLALGAAFATAGGAAIFRMVPVLGTILGMLNPIGVGLAVLALTSSKVREAFVNLGKALLPVIAVVKNAAGALLNVLGYAVGFVGKAINGLATVVNYVVQFFVRHERITRLLAGAFAFAVATALAYKAAMITMAAASAVATFATEAYAVAMVLMEGAELASIASTNGLAASLLAADAAMLPISGTVLAVVGAVLALAAGMIYLYNTNETARKVITDVFNKVANVVGLVIGTVLGWLGQLLLGLGNLMDTHTTFGTVVANVLQFIYQGYLTYVQIILGWYKSWLDAIEYITDRHNVFGKFIATVLNFIGNIVVTAVILVIKMIKSWFDAFNYLFQGHTTLAKIVSAVFKFVVEIIGGAINIVLQVFANLLKGVAVIVHIFGYLKDFMGVAWNAIWKVISTVWGWIESVFKAIWNGIKTVVSFVKNLIADLVDALAKPVGWIDKITGKDWAGTLKEISNGLRGIKDNAETFKETSVGPTDSKKSIDAITTVGVALAKATQSWGNFTTGPEAAISGFANKISELGEKIVTYAGNVEGLKVIDALASGADTASKALQTVLDGLEKIKDVKVGNYITDTVSKTAEFASNTIGEIIKRLQDAKGFDIGTALTQGVSDVATKAGNALIGISAGIESFLSGDVLGKAIDGLGSFIDSLKESVGFGDILKSLQEKFQGNAANPNATSADALGKNTAADIKNKADQMQKIRDAMNAGLDAIKKVMDDLRQAAKDFANSLKDTIVGFAGLKGVELPDGFIPQAKSLIENMQMKLNKATQFSAQIAQLQAMNLDAGALKDIIEAGPIQGAQLAAAILGGGQEAVDQVSSLQKAIEFAGAAIGNQGMVAAGYPAMIDAAQAKYNSIANAELAVGGNGTIVNITEGAFKISIDTSKATTPEEATAIIENAISNAFATLGKELAAK